jgi:hypothetical protein
MRFILIIFLGLNVFTYGQTIIHHQALSSQGTGIKLSNGMYVNQTVGQQNVIGNYSKKGNTYGQGYQQASKKIQFKKTPISGITTINYPNPFVKSTYFQFSKPIEDLISVSVFDLQGRLVYQQNMKAEGAILTVALEQLPVSNYMIQLSAFNFIYSSKILKQ